MRPAQHTTTPHALPLTVWPARPEAPDDLPPLVALHGFFGDGQDWAPVAEALRWPGLVAAPELPGHDLVDPTSPITMRACAEAVADTCARLAPRVVLCGYSMGGRVALNVALDHPERVAALILISASPGLERDEDRAARILKDEALAARAETIGASALWDLWSLVPIIATQQRTPSPWREAMSGRRRARSAAALAASLRGMGTGAQPSRWGELERVQAPTLLLTGAEDAKFEQIASHMLARGLRAEHTSIAEAGHSPHLEQIEATTRALDAFLSAHTHTETP